MSTALKNKSLSTAELREMPGRPSLQPTAANAVRLFFNRELSLLEFHRRVLEEGFNKSTPLLERLKFLGIFSANLDEFFMIRVSGLKEELDENVTELSPDGMTPGEQLKEIRTRVMPLVDDQARSLRDEILPELGTEGIEVLPYRELNRDQKEELDAYFRETVFPILTPLAVDQSNHFPIFRRLA